MQARHRKIPRGKEVKILLSLFLLLSVQFLQDEFINITEIVISVSSRGGYSKMVIYNVDSITIPWHSLVVFIILLDLSLVYLIYCLILMLFINAKIISFSEF